MTPGLPLGHEFKPCPHASCTCWSKCEDCDGDQDCYRDAQGLCHFEPGARDDSGNLLLCRQPAAAHAADGGCDCFASGPDAAREHARDCPAHVAMGEGPEPELCDRCGVAVQYGLCKCDLLPAQPPRQEEQPKPHQFKGYGYPQTALTYDPCIIEQCYKPKNDPIHAAPPAQDGGAGDERPKPRAPFESERWQVGFDDGATADCLIPGMTPIVSLDRGFCFGAVVAQFESKDDAEAVVRAHRAISGIADQEGWVADAEKILRDFESCVVSAFDNENERTLTWAEADAIEAEYPEGDSVSWVCMLCGDGGKDRKHTADCPVTAASALLARKAGQASGSAPGPRAE